MNERMRIAGAAATILGMAVAVTAAVLSRAGVEPFATWLYQFAWYGMLTAAAGAMAARDGRVPLTAGQAASLLFWSIPFWYLFEAANFRLANWYYVLVPPELPVRWVGSAVAFATVIPALHLAHRWMLRAGLARDWRTGGFDLRPGVLRATAGAGALFVALALWRPGIFFPLIWGALTLLLEPWNCRRDPGSSLLADLARGRPGRIVRLLAGGLVVGLVWETVNASAAASWIYTVPGLEQGKLFEMPLPGYLGFPVLALDAFVAYRALAHLGLALPAWRQDDPGPEVEASASAGASARAGGATPGQGAEASVAGRGRREGDEAERGGSGPGFRPGRAVAAGILALALSAAIQAGVDYWTVDSCRSGLAGLPGVDGEEASALRRAGIEEPAALARLDSAAVAARAGLPAAEAGAAVRAARLARLRGLGAANAAVLWDTGIRSVCELAEAGQIEVARAVGAGRSGPRAGHRPRVRVWLAAARRGCPCGC